MDDKIQTSKLCPFCNNEIAVEAKKCKHCKKWLDEVQEQISEEETETKLCVFCGEKIPSAAKKCRHCKNWVAELEERTEKQKDLPNTKQCPYCLNDNSYIKQVLNLKFLAPEITEAILNGTQARDLTMAKLFNLKTLDWQEQKNVLEMC